MKAHLIFPFVDRNSNNLIDYKYQNSMHFYESLTHVTKSQFISSPSLT